MKNLKSLPANKIGIEDPVLTHVRFPSPKFLHYFVIILLAGLIGENSNFDAPSTTRTESSPTENSDKSDDEPTFLLEFGSDFENSQK